MQFEGHSTHINVYIHKIDGKIAWDISNMLLKIWYFRTTQNHLKTQGSPCILIHVWLLLF